MQELSCIRTMSRKKLQWTDSRLHTLFHFLYRIGFGKRFAAYEIMGEIFREEKESLLAMTLWNRLLACMEKLLMALAESLGADPIVMLQGLLNNREYGKQIMVIASALQEYCSENQRDVV